MCSFPSPRKILNPPMNVGCGADAGNRTIQTEHGNCWRFAWWRRIEGLVGKTVGVRVPLVALKNHAVLVSESSSSESDGERVGEVSFPTPDRSISVAATRRVDCRSSAPGAM